MATIDFQIMVSVGALGFAVILPNSLFLIALVKKRTLHVPSNMLLGFLCLSDLLLGLAVFFLVASLLPAYIMNSVPSRMFVYRFVYTSAGLYGLSAQFLALISIDRYVAICRPFAYVKHATCKLHLTIAMFIFFFDAAIFSIWRFTETGMVIDFNTGFTTVSFILTFPPLVFCNWKIFKVIRRIRREVASVGGQQTRNQRETKRNTTVLTLVFLFFVCVAPFIVFSLIFLFGADTNNLKAKFIVTFALFLPLLNSLVNPLVYCFRMRSFRTAMKEALCCRWSVA